MDRSRLPTGEDRPDDDDVVDDDAVVRIDGMNVQQNKMQHQEWVTQKCLGHKPDPLSIRPFDIVPQRMAVWNPKWRRDCPTKFNCLPSQLTIRILNS